jgi:hypothetical protein
VARTHAERRVRRALLGLVISGLTCAAGAQKPAAADDKVDPYTQNDAKALERAGYVRYGPFRWANDHDTKDLEKVLGGGNELKLTETAHFRIATSLPPYPMPKEKDERARLQDELRRLKKKLPKVDPEAKKLDPWLRHHLIAQRCEEFFDEFCKRFAVDTKALPLLGQKNKFSILQIEKATQLERYYRRYMQVETSQALRWNFAEDGSFFFGACTEHTEGKLATDRALHCQLVFNLTHVFVAGYKGYFYPAPIWFEEGLAHWFERRIDPELNHFGSLKDSEGVLTQEWDWKPKVRARVANEAFTSAEKMFAWRDPGEVTFGDHMQIWSRIEFLATLGEEKLAVYLNAVKGRQDENGNAPPADVLAKVAAEALQKAYGLTPVAFDEAWRKWVLK